MKRLITLFLATILVACSVPPFGLHPEKTEKAEIPVSPAVEVRAEQATDAAPVVKQEAPKEKAPAATKQVNPVACEELDPEPTKEAVNMRLDCLGKLIRK